MNAFNIHMSERQRIGSEVLHKAILPKEEDHRHCCCLTRSVAVCPCCEQHILCVDINIVTVRAVWAVVKGLNEAGGTFSVSTSFLCEVSVGDRLLDGMLRILWGKDAHSLYGAVSERS